jgi:hypothetical protein
VLRAVLRSGNIPARPPAAFAALVVLVLAL